MFPYLMDHDGTDMGGDGCQRAEFAFNLMPEATAAALVEEEREKVDAANICGLGEVSNSDDDYEAEEALAEISMQSRQRCMDWLVAHFDDARLLSSSSHDHLPLTFKLAQHLAPIGATLELWVETLSDRPLLAPRGWEWEARKRAWASAVVIDNRNRVVYSLNESYFSKKCTPADELATQLMHTQLVQDSLQEADKTECVAQCNAPCSPAKRCKLGSCGNSSCGASSCGASSCGASSCGPADVEGAEWAGQGGGNEEREAAIEGMLCSVQYRPYTGQCMRRWCKDGGIAPCTYTWLRCRKRLPRSILNHIQGFLGGGRDVGNDVGSNIIRSPGWLNYRAV
jgi:hypothetical protein